MGWSTDAERQLSEDERRRAEGLRGTAWRQAEVEAEPTANKTKAERRKSKALNEGLVEWIRNHRYLVPEKPGGVGGDDGGIVAAMGSGP